MADTTNDEKVPDATAVKDHDKRGHRPSRKRLPIGWLILAALILLEAYFISIPVALLTLAFISGAPLFTIMLGAAALGALSLTDGSDMLGLTASHRGFGAEFNGMIEHILDVGLGDQVEVMSTIPLFIYAGYLLAEAGTADRLVRFANAMLGWAPGGLAIVTIGTCALFTVFTGASGVTIIALGGVLMPALVRAGYPERFSMGLIAGTGSVGLLFPPALPLFIYGTVYGLTQLDPENWKTERFLFAGIVPGLVLVGMLSAVAVTVALVRRLPRQKFDFAELGKSFLLALPELFIPFGVILGLAAGFGLPEIAALTVVYTVLLEVGLSRVLTKVVAWGKPLDPKVLWTTSREGLAMVGAIFIIIFASTAMTNFLVTAKVPEKLVHWTTSHVESKIVFLLAINVILLIVGTVMDIFSAIVVVLPLIGPIAKAYGIDPYHLGVIFLLNLEVGYLHPPVGLNLFITSIKFQRPITEVMWATIPFLITMIIALLTITYVPQLTAWSVPPERNGSVRTLVAMVHEGVEDSKVAEKDIKLVDAAGTELKDAKGQSVTMHYKDCAGITDETKKGACQNLFFDVTGCKADPAKFDDCKHHAIAKWTVANMNNDPLDQEKALIVVQEVPLVDDKGEPAKDPDDKPIVGADGKPRVKKLATCAALKGTDRETCRSLFIDVSSCKIDPPDAGADGCTADKVASWISDHPDEAKKD
jgi:tripartite ATP-independent transporter DctM subunit